MQLMHHIWTADRSCSVCKIKVRWDIFKSGIIFRWAGCDNFWYTVIMRHFLGFLSYFVSDWQWHWEGRRISEITKTQRSPTRLFNNMCGLLFWWLEIACVCKCLLPRTSTLAHFLNRCEISLLSCRIPVVFKIHTSGNVTNFVICPLRLRLLKTRVWRSNGVLCKYMCPVFAGSPVTSFWW